MTKLLVETKGSFMLMDPMSNTEIESHRPTVVVLTSFVDMHINGGRIRKLGELVDEATDIEFLEHFRSSDQDVALAAASYLAMREVKEDEVEAEEGETDPTKVVQPDLDELRKTAADLGIKFVGNMGAEKLIEKIDAARSEAAAHTNPIVE